MLTKKEQFVKLEYKDSTLFLEKATQVFEDDIPFGEPVVTRQAINLSEETLIINEEAKALIPSDLVFLFNPTLFS